MVSQYQDLYSQGITSFLSLIYPANPTCLSKGAGKQDWSANISYRPA